MVTIGPSPAGVDVSLPPPPERMSMTSTATVPPISLFYSYAHEDEPLRDELASHLKILERRGLIQAWHDRQIRPGQAWDRTIDQHLSAADLVLLLISKDFIGSDYIWGVELAQAMHRQQAGQCEVVPIIVRAVDIDPSDADDLPFLKLQGLPPDLKPVTSWDNRDEAWTQVAKGLRSTVNAIRARKPALRPADLPVPPAAAVVPGQGDPFGSRGTITARSPAATPDAELMPRSPPQAPPAAPDPQFDALVQGFVHQVDQAQRARGGPPLFDHHRYLVEREAVALIDRPDPVRVLWVDDQPRNNLNERAMLARLQIEVVAVTGTAEALARIAADRAAGEAFDLVITDWSRRADGPGAALSLLRALRAAGQQVPLVVYHGEFDVAVRQRRADQVQAEGALGEAVLPAELMALVQRAIGA